MKKHAKHVLYYNIIMVFAGATDVFLFFEKNSTRRKTRSRLEEDVRWRKLFPAS